MKKQIVITVLIIGIFLGIAARTGIIDSPIFGTSAKFNFATPSTAAVFDADKNLVSAAGNLGTAAFLNVGTSANNLIQLNSSAQLPAVDGSLLTGVSSGSGMNNPEIVGTYYSRGSFQLYKATSQVATYELQSDHTLFTISDGDTYSCRITVTGRDANGDSGTGVYHILVRRIGSTTSSVGAVQEVIAYHGDLPANWYISANDINDSLTITVSPTNDTVTRWTAVIEYVKISY